MISNEPIKLSDRVLFNQLLCTFLKVVILDNQEIHNSTGRVNTFYHSFIVRGKHVVKLEANLTRHENLNQYDLWIDGISFFRMPKVTNDVYVMAAASFVLISNPLILRT